MKKLFRRLSETRWWVLLLGVTGIAALFFLAASLNDMEFKPAIHYVPPGEASRPSPEFLQSMLSASFVEQILLAGVFVVILCVVLLLLTPEGRKRLLKTLVRTVLMFLVIYWAINKYRQPEEVVEDAGGAAAGMGLKNPPVEGVVAVYTPPAVPPWLVFLTGVVVILALLGAGYWLWKRSQPRKRSLTDELADIARSALNEIRAGGAFEDTVVQCYVRMSAAVTTQRGLERPQAMTPSEFSLRLEQAGLPADPVRRLTRLFEKVRYGGVKSSQNEADEAIACLTAILHYCGESA